MIPSELIPLKDYLHTSNPINLDLAVQLAKGLGCYKQLFSYLRDQVVSSDWTRELLYSDFHLLEHIKNKKHLMLMGGQPVDVSIYPSLAGIALVMVGGSQFMCTNPIHLNVLEITGLIPCLDALKKLKPKLVVCRHIDGGVIDLTWLNPLITTGIAINACRSHKIKLKISRPRFFDLLIDGSQLITSENLILV